MRAFKLPIREEAPIAFSSDGTTLASASNTKLLHLSYSRINPQFKFVGGEVLIWDAKTGKLQKTLPGDNTMAVAFAPTDNHLLSLRYIRNKPDDAFTVGSILTSFDPLTGKVQWAIQGRGDDWFFGPPAYSPESKVFACEMEGNRINLWDAASGRRLRTLTQFPHIGKAAVGLSNFPLAFSPDGKMIASHNGKSVLLWQVTP